MVSGVRYRTFKSFSIRRIRPFQALVLGALLIVLVSFSPEVTLFVAGYSYLISGIIETVFVLKRDVLQSDEDEEADSGEDDQNITVLPS